MVLKMVQIPRIGRKALLPIVGFRETKDPPTDVVERFKILTL